MNTLTDLAEHTRRAVCMAAALCIVASGLLAGSASTDAAFADAWTASKAHVEIVQLASL